MASGCGLRTLDLRHILTWGCSLMRFISSMLPSDSSMLKRRPSQALRQPASSVGLTSARTWQGPCWSRRSQSPVCSRGGDHQTVQALPISPKQVTQSLQARGNASSKLAWLCPAPQAVPIHQLSCCLPARRSAVVACQHNWKCHRQPDRAGAWGSHLRGASCGTVMDEATRDDIPGIFHSIPHIWQTPLAEQLWSSHSTNRELFPRGPHHGPQESWKGTRGLC